VTLRRENCRYRGVSDGICLRFFPSTSLDLSIFISSQAVPFYRCILLRIDVSLRATAHPQMCRLPHSSILSTLIFSPHTRSNPVLPTITMCWPFLENSLSSSHATRSSSVLMAIPRQEHCSVSGVSSRALYQRIDYTFRGASIAEDAVRQQLQQANKTVRRP
jgi:hypothetical protein